MQAYENGEYFMTFSFTCMASDINRKRISISKFLLNIIWPIKSGFFLHKKITCARKDDASRQKELFDQIIVLAQ